MLLISLPMYLVPTKTGKRCDIPSLNIKLPLDGKSLENLSETIRFAIAEAVKTSVKSVEIVEAQRPGFRGSEDDLERFIVILREWKDIVEMVLKIEPLVEDMEAKRRKSKIEQPSALDNLLAAYPEI